jgi:hypothetical protein
MEAKLAKLKNAWDTFTMGIMDSEFVKAGIELLTALITAINKLTEAFGPFDGAAKIGLLVAALYLGDKALSIFLKKFTETKSVVASFKAVGDSVTKSVKKSIDRMTKAMQDYKIKVEQTAEKIKKMKKIKIKVNTKEAQKSMQSLTLATK